MQLRDDSACVAARVYLEFDYKPGAKVFNASFNHNPVPLQARIGFVDVLVGKKFLK